jgi:hypothetical protein
MKKRYKGYFKKKTNTLNEVRFKKIVIKEFNFKDKPRVGLWVNTYLKYINKS